MGVRRAARQRSGREHGARRGGGRLTAGPAPAAEAASGRGRESESARGRLKVYLGTTPGSGKTYGMLREAHDLAGHGHDVVVGYVETYGRPRTVEMLQGLPILPRKRVEYRGTVLEDMDLELVLERRPEIALVDELAHTNAPGLRNAKRWQDVEELRDAGIDVITTVNVQHLESVKDLVEKVTGVIVRETLPDRVLDGADAVRFIDIAPEALRKRMRHGNVYPAERVEAALANFFRPRNLAALREIGLRLVADSMAGHRRVIGSPEDVLVATSGGPASEDLMRRGARLARRRGGSCLVVTILAGLEPPEGTERLRDLAGQLGCAYAILGGRDVAAALIQAAQDFGADHLVIGEESTESPLGRLRPTTADRIIDGLPDSDVHVIAHRRRPLVAPRARQETGEDGRRPDPVALLREVIAGDRRRAALRVYVSYAPGCGTTAAMLDEARRRAGRGTDVVVAAYEVHGDPRQALAGIEVVGGMRAGLDRRPLDVEALLARNPEVACIDDLTALDSDGRPCVEGVPRLVDAGITVLATLHLLSLRSVSGSVSSLLGRPLSRPTLDDGILDLIDEFELVDLPPEDLIRRIRENMVLTPAQLALAMQRELRPEVLARLRENLLRICADRVDRQLVGELRDPAGGGPAEVRGRIVLCLPVRTDMEGRIRAAAGYAEAQDATLTVVSVQRRGLSDEHKAILGTYSALTRRLGGEFVRLDGRLVAPTLAAFIAGSPATEVIIGHKRRGRWRPWDTSTALIRRLQGIDIHILRRIAHGERAGQRTDRPSG